VQRPREKATQPKRARAFAALAALAQELSAQVAPVYALARWMPLFLLLAVCRKERDLAQQRLLLEQIGAVVVVVVPVVEVVSVVEAAVVVSVMEAVAEVVSVVEAVGVALAVDAAVQQVSLQPELARE